MRRGYHMVHRIVCHHVADRIGLCRLQFSYFQHPGSEQRSLTSHPYVSEAANPRPRWSITPALSSPDHRPDCTLLTGGCTVGKRGRGDGRDTRALPFSRQLVSLHWVSPVWARVGHRSRLIVRTRERTFRAQPPRQQDKLRLFHRDR